MTGFSLSLTLIVFSLSGTSLRGARSKCNAGWPETRWRTHGSGFRGSWTVAESSPISFRSRIWIAARPAVPTETVKLQNSGLDGVPSRAQLLLRRQGFGRLLHVEQQSAGVADEVVVNGHIGVEAGGSAARPGFELPLAHQQLEIAVDRTQRDARQRAPHLLVDP